MMGVLCREPACSSLILSGRDDPWTPSWRVRNSSSVITTAAGSARARRVVCCGCFLEQTRRHSMLGSRKLHSGDGGGVLWRRRRPDATTSQNLDLRVRRQRRGILASSSSESKGQEGDGDGGSVEQLAGDDSAPLNVPQVAFQRNADLSAASQELFDGCIAEFYPPSEQQRRGSDLATLLRRFWKVAAPYWSSEDKVKARWWLAGVFALTLATTGISVGFNFLGRDFYNALASKDQEEFLKQLTKYFAAFIGGIPVFVLRDYFRDTLALRWRGWMTTQYLDNYFENRAFYNIQSQSLIDNPDQRIVDDLNSFSGSALGFALALFNATINLISFSGILYGIYPPLFYVLVIYSVGGTAVSVALGKDLIGLNFMQEKKEADFRYGLVRVRENAESIAFYGGECSEIQLLLQRFKQSFDNYSKLLIASRNLDFFTSFYRYLIQLLPAAVVAPLYFAGKIEFGVINQSFSAFNNVLSDFSIIVYQFQSLSAFSAVVDRLGEFTDILEEQSALFQTSSQNGGTKTNSVQPDGTSTRPHNLPTEKSQINLVDIQDLESTKQSEFHPLLVLENITLSTPQYTMTLFKDLSLVVNRGEHLLIMGASGSGKTSLLRAIAGLWRSGAGCIKRYVKSREDGKEGDKTKGVFKTDQVGSSGQNSPEEKDGVEGQTNGALVPDSVSMSSGEVFFLPQRPYMVLGTLRQQLLYPTWSEEEMNADTTNGSLPFVSKQNTVKSSAVQRFAPNDYELVEVLERVRLGHLMDRCDGLDSYVEWASILSLGEQQRLAFARLLLSRPKLALMDESTSALDENNEISLYTALQEAGVTFISVGHRSSLRRFHTMILQFAEPKEGLSTCTWTFEKLTEVDSEPKK